MIKEFNIAEFREGNRCEVKLASGGLPSSIRETYSAFANTDGGLILLGVRERADHSLEAVGVENPEALIKTFWDTVNNRAKVSLSILMNKHVYIRNIENKKLSA